jgi:hypothetical protein
MAIESIYTIQNFNFTIKELIPANDKFYAIFYENEAFYATPFTAFAVLLVSRPDNTRGLAIYPVTTHLINLLYNIKEAVNLSGYFTSYVSYYHQNYFDAKNAALPLEDRIPIKYERNHSNLFSIVNPNASNILNELDTIFNEF